MHSEARGGRKLINRQNPRLPYQGYWPATGACSKALIRAHPWRRRSESGQAKSITDLAEQEGLTDAYVCRLLPLTCLAPDIVEAIVDGRQPKGLRLWCAAAWHSARVGGAPSRRVGCSACCFSGTAPVLTSRAILLLRIG
jgi:hypothetical protein